MRKVILGLLLTLGLAGAAHAEEGGSISLEIEGETYNFSLWAGQSDWSGSEAYGSVNIYSRPADDDSGKRFQLFTLGFEVINGASGEPEAGLIRLVDGKREKLFAGKEDDEGGLVIEIENVSVAGDELNVNGTFTTQMGTSENYGRNIDLTSPVPVTGSFDVVLGPVE